MKDITTNGGFMIQFQLDVHQVNAIISALNFQASFSTDLAQKVQSAATQQVVMQQAQAAALASKTETAQNTGEQNGNQENTYRLQESGEQNNQAVGKKGRSAKGGQKKRGRNSRR